MTSRTGRMRGRADVAVVRRLVPLLAALAAAAALLARVPAVRDAVREPITMAAVAVLVRPWETRGAWTVVAPPPTAKLEPAAAVVDGKLYVFGGFVTSPRRHEFPVEPRVSVYDPRTDTWSRAADMPVAVTHANAVVVGGEVWMAGGFEGADPGPAVTTVLRYDPGGDWAAAARSRRTRRAGS